MTRRRLLFGALLVGLVLVSLVLVLKRSRERHQQRQEEAKQRALEEYERQPGPPEYLVAFSRTPHDGFRAFKDVEADDAKYRGKVFRVVGKASSYRFVPDAGRAELEIKDRDDTATFHLHAIASPARLEALQREGVFLEPPACDAVNAELVVVDGIFESRALFTHCYIRWKGKGNDWAAALREAKKGLNLDAINRR